MSKLHELLAVELDSKGRYNKLTFEAKNTFSKKPGLFNGHIKTLEMFDDDEKQSNGVVEHQEVTETVQSKLEYIFDEAVNGYFDILLSKEKTNQNAKANLIIDGETFVEDAPATWLLGMESRLAELRGVLESIPTLPPGIKWVPDPDKGDNIMKSERSEESFKTLSTIKPVIMVEPTIQHPAQVEKVKDVKNVGKYSTERWCSMITPARKSQLISRVDKLIAEIKKARQQANCEEVVDEKVGDKIRDYIIG